ncbi:MAG TPA: sulfotransferase [Allosphingosinicella sp.]|jgi:tetratricopeptide (TPR) repeat protein
MQFGSHSRSPQADQERLRAIQAALARGDMAAAGEAAARAMAQGLEHPLVLSLAAGRLEAAGRLNDALALLVRAKRLAPQDAGVRNALGICLSRSGRHEEAIGEFSAAVALEPALASAYAARAHARVALARLNEARGDFEQALTIEPRNPFALGGLASLALRRGDAAEARRLAAGALEIAPEYPDAALTLAGACIAAGEPGAAEAQLQDLLASPRPQPLERAIGEGLLGDALDAQGRFPEAFSAYTSANARMRAIYRPSFEGRQTTLAFIRDLARHLEGRRLPPPAAPASGGPARTHVFLAGFPRSGTTLLEQVLEEHPDTVTLAEKECMIDAGRALMSSRDRFDALLALPDAQLEPYRAAYWKRVAEEGVDVRDKVFVDKHPFHSFKLPLIARLFPEARILVARRDPRDIVLSCFRYRFEMTDPMYQMLTLEGTAELFDAAMALIEATRDAFGRDLLDCANEALVADFDGETKRICGWLGIAWSEGMRDFASNVGARGVFTPSAAQIAGGLSGSGVGKWRDYAQQLAPVLPRLEPWVRRFGYS